MMLMTVPLMIWSARTVIAQPGVEHRDEHPGADRGEDADEQRRVTPKIALGSRPGIASLTTHADHEADERRRQHHPLDADVDDAAALVHDPAQRAEGDRRRQLQGLRGEVRRE